MNLSNGKNVFWWLSGTRMSYIYLLLSSLHHARFIYKIITLLKIKNSEIYDSNASPKSGKRCQK